MDYPTLFLLFSFILTFIYATTISVNRNSRLPPGPYPLPIIGNLLQLGENPHISLTRLSKRFGPLMSLKLGSRITIVISSPDIAKEFFQTNDQSFSNRSVPDTARVMDHKKYSIVWLPVSDQWRKLRRITKEYIFSLQHLDANELIRKEKVQELLEHVDHCCANEKPVSIGGVVFTTMLNVLSNFMFSMDLSQYDSASSQEFKNAVWGIMEIAGKPNLADFFPVFKPFDPQGLVRQGNIFAEKLLTILDRIIDQRLQSYDGVIPTKNDVLDSLLNLYLKDEGEFSRNDLRHLFFALFIAGTDTTSSTLEWAMAELIRNPEKMKTARSEIIKHMHNNTRDLQELDFSQLSFLQAVIKETLRLHPAAPFLVPHQAIHDVEVQGFIVPKNAQILCNVWGMGRDPKIWSDPETFLPERFLEAKIDYKGQDFELIPFGAGRRICPGLNLAHRMLHTILGSLIHKFDWKLEKNMKPEDTNMDERFGLTLSRSVPLVAIPIRL